MVNLGPDFIILNHDFAVKHCLLLFVIEAGGGDLLDLVKKRRLPYPENIFRTDNLLFPLTELYVSGKLLYIYRILYICRNQCVHRNP